MRFLRFLLAFIQKLCFTIVSFFQKLVKGVGIKDGGAWKIFQKLVSGGGEIVRYSRVLIHSDSPYHLPNLVADGKPTGLFQLISVAPPPLWKNNASNQRPEVHDKMWWKDPDFASKSTGMSRLFKFTDNLALLPLSKEEFASNMKVWIFPIFCHNPRIFASWQLHAPGFWGIFAYYHRIFSGWGGGYGYDGY